ncbi:MAG TPA: hypothetical protein VK701_03910 [Solirubrobacteraceae bacterium]|jgi:hypothetical protein|nr:hypothetical protein [Solirubrobacteraceae bacterium]
MNAGNLARSALALGLAMTATVSGAQAILPAPAAAGKHPAAGTPVAHVSRTIGVREEGSLRFLSDEATLIVDEGPLSGTLPGRGRVYFTYDGSPDVTARFAIRTSAGTVEGRATCLLHNPNNPTPSFRGALQIVGGSGRYAHAHGSGELFGVFHRHGYGLIVQAVGRLSY